MEKKLIRNIRNKLKQNNLIVTKADKGNTLVIIQQDDYHQKVDEFITQNQFVKIDDNHTKKQHNAIKTTINQCKTIIKQTEKWKYQNMNSETPHIHGTIKLHKEEKSVRPIVNWKNSPGYKIATVITRLLMIPYTYHIHTTY
jgi:hypothetical protein